MGERPCALEAVVTAMHRVAARPDPAFWRGRRVLLTGHTGFKGTWLALWLHQLGADVVGLALDPPSEPSLFAQTELAPLIDDRRIELLDAEAVAAVVQSVQPQVVLHLAAQSLVREGYRRPLQTWNANVLGSLHLLEALRPLQHPCAVVLVTTDKVYANAELGKPFCEHDPLGGHDPYSGSKAALELAVASWRQSYCGDAPHQTPLLRLGTARAGNVIGGGDWAADRIVPDAIRALQHGQPVQVRNPGAIRPWQHVLDPLAGYLLLAERMHADVAVATAFNFGPDAADQRSVGELVEEMLQHWPGGQWLHAAESAAPRESDRLLLDASLARRVLGWQPRWSFTEAVARTADWYQRCLSGDEMRGVCTEQIAAYGLG